MKREREGTDEGREIERERMIHEREYERMIHESEREREHKAVQEKEGKGGR